MIEVSTATRNEHYNLPPWHVNTIYRDRSEAGKQLASRLLKYANRHDVFVLALPRGGVPVAYEVATSLNAPLDVFVVRKLGVPGHEEVPMGAIASGGVRVLNGEVIESYSIAKESLDQVTALEFEELLRREREYRDDTSAPDVLEKTVLLVDDGLAMGSTMRAAVLALRQHHPRRIVVAVPVSSRDTCDEYKMCADEVVCAATPEPFFGVGSWYDDFSQTTDGDVRHLLRASTEQING